MAGNCVTGEGMSKAYATSEKRMDGQNTAVALEEYLSNVSGR